MVERLKKLNGVLQQELGKIILKEVDFPRNILVTLTRVETSKDLSQSKVFVSVLPDRETDNILWVLNTQSYRLHQLLNKKISIRRVPKLTFLEEKDLMQGHKVDEILEKIKMEKRE